ncbi:MAG: glutathione S-transferase [Pseudomonadota bacterium]
MALKLDDCINKLCPWSGDPVSEDSLTVYKGQVVGFCNPGCRDKFETATSFFEERLNENTKDQVHG